ncbi:MAG: hypothetical protein U1F76_20955 [Candidatus Competibacteraceae bacterium]
MKVIDIFNSDGTVSPYRLLSDRLPDFLNRYGPDQGYAIVIEAQDPLSLRPGLLRLYEAAIAAGHAPEAVGLPPPRDISMVFQAKLLDRECRLVCNASALKPIREYKEWECAETAARQRLLAALGFGGDVLDADESRDMSDQGLKTGTTATAPPAPAVTKPSKPAAPTVATPSTPPAPTVATPSKSPAPAVTTPPKPPAPAAAVTTPPASPPAPPVASPAAATVAAVPTSTETAPATGKTIPASVLRQLEHQARLKGVPTPVVTSLEEAKAELQRLFKLQPVAATPSAA